MSLTPLLGALSPLGFARSLATLTYLLRDEFSTNHAAPLTSPRTCEPGPGTLTIVDTGNKASIVDTRLALAGYSVQWADPRVYSSAITRSTGKGLYYKAQGTGVTRPFTVCFNTINTSASGANTLSIYPLTTINVLAQTLIDTNIAYVANTDIECFLILRGVGSFALMKVGADWKLLWVENSVSVSPVYIVASIGSTTATGKIDSIRHMQLGSPFDTDNGLATSLIANPAVNDEIVQEVNSTVEMTWPAATGETWDLMVRRTNDDNCDIVRCNQGSSTIKYITKVSGIETERSSAAQTFTNGASYRVSVIMDGNVKYTYVNSTVKNSYSGASVNSGMSAKTNKAGTNFIAWPRVLSGTALAELNRWAA